MNRHRPIRNPISLRADLFDVVGVASILRVILESGQYFRIVVDQSRMPRAELLEPTLKRRGALLHEYPLRVGRRGPHFSGPSAGATLRG